MFPNAIECRGRPVTRVRVSGRSFKWLTGQDSAARTLSAKSATVNGFARIDEY